MVKTQKHVLMVLFQVQAMNARLRTKTCFSRLPGPIFGRTAEQHSSCRDKRLFLFLLRNISTSFAFCKGNHYSPHSDGLILNYAGENTSKNARNRTRQSPTPPPLGPQAFCAEYPTQSRQEVRIPANDDTPSAYCIHTTTIKTSIPF